MKRIVASILLVMLLPACTAPVEITPISTLLPTESSTPTTIGAPTETPTPTVPMIEVGGLQIPDPKVSNPELFDLTKHLMAENDSPIVQFANAFGVTPEEVGDLTPQLLIGIDGKQFVVLTTEDLAATTNFDESGTPLLIAELKENEEWKWSETSPAKLFSLNDRILELSVHSYKKEADGTYVYLFNEGSDYSELVKKLGNRIVITGELDMNWVFSDFTKDDWNRILTDWPAIKEKLDTNEIPAGFEYAWKATQSLIDFADSNGMQIRAQHLTCDDSIPEAFNSYSAEQIKKLLEFTVKARVIKFGSKIRSWDLVDEAVARTEYAPGFWTGGKLDALTTAKLTAQFVREVYPNARLIVVEDLVFEDFPDNNFTNNFLAFLDTIKQMGVQVDAVSIENNFWIYDPINVQKIERVVEELNIRSIPLEGGETTINVSPIYSNWPARPKTTNINDDPFLIQAGMYAQLLSLYQELGISSFGLGNVEDESSWQASMGFPDSKSSLVINEQGEKKPAWYSFMSAALQDFK